MAVLTIMTPDRMRGRTGRSTIRDDEAGTVEVTHHEIRRVCGAPKPITIGHPGRV